MQIPPEQAIHLSVVATSRNDNHGGFLTERMQHFVDGFVAQCKRHELRAELILVEWNPPGDRKPLEQELRWPEDCGPCEIRIVTVPREVHERLPHADKLPLFQMIAKNVGIRRARGRFVLATNIDILFSDEASLFMRNQLTEGHLYRADRLDVPTSVPTGVGFDDVLQFCRREAFRIHATGFTLVKRNGRWDPSSPMAAMLHVVWRSTGQSLVKIIQNGTRNVAKGLRALSAVVALGIFSITFRLNAFVRTTFGLLPPRHIGQTRERLAERIGRSMTTLRKIFGNSGLFIVGRIRSLISVWSWTYHALIRRELFTNACGDFTLLSRTGWFALRGYPEWPMYSWHLDSILLYQAHRSGIRETYLGKNAPIFHIEHEPGSGFTPESSEKLFERLTARGIPYLDWQKNVVPLIAEMNRARRMGSVVTYNDDNWGFGDKTLRDIRVGKRTSIAAGPATPGVGDRNAVSASASV